MDYLRKVVGLMKICFPCNTEEDIETHVLVHPRIRTVR
jgi:hypothetical protein